MKKPETRPAHLEIPEGFVDGIGLDDADIPPAYPFVVKPTRKTISKTVLDDRDGIRWVSALTVIRAPNCVSFSIAKGDPTTGGRFIDGLLTLPEARALMGALNEALAN